MKKHVVLTIAGSDCSGGAGIQADLAVIGFYGLYGESVITAVTAQNTRGVVSVQALSVRSVAQQLDCVFSDIVPDAVKIGMIPTRGVAAVIADRLGRYGCGPAPGQIPVVIDPVFAATSGHILCSHAALPVVVTQLFPLASVITPNLQEHAFLGELSYPDRAAVLVKGGHAVCSDAVDTLYFPVSENNIRITQEFRSKRIDNPDTHGTGCTLSSALACGLAEGRTLTESVFCAKQYTTACIAAGLHLGHGRGPLWHFSK
jgi:hydroxymethylpyrimidine/phosphomethylpyrimidine kinase